MSETILLQALHRTVWTVSVKYVLRPIKIIGFALRSALQYTRTIVNLENIDGSALILIVVQV